MANAKEVVQDAKRAEHGEKLEKLFEGSYDLTKQPDKQKLVEALGEIGKTAAVTCTDASVSLTFGPNGITGLTVTTTPSEPKPGEKKDEIKDQ